MCQCVLDQPRRTWVGNASLTEMAAAMEADMWAWWTKAILPAHPAPDVSRGGVVSGSRILPRLIPECNESEKLVPAEG